MREWSLPIGSNARINSAIREAARRHALAASERAKTDRLGVAGRSGIFPSNYHAGRQKSPVAIDSLRPFRPVGQGPVVCLDFLAVSTIIQVCFYVRSNSW